MHIRGKRASYVYGDHNQIILTSHLSRSDHITLKILKFKLYSIISIWKTIIFVIVYDNKYNKFVNIHRAKQAAFWVGSSGGIKNSTTIEDTKTFFYHKYYGSLKQINQIFPIICLFFGMKLVNIQNFKEIWPHHFCQIPFRPFSSTSFRRSVNRIVDNYILLINICIHKLYV